jgi:predicted nuclease of predicted toxin-antitoxin system
MKLLLDENLPVQFKNDFPEYEVFTVRDQGWLGKENGDLLKALLEKGFDVLITADKNIENQQNFKTYPIPVVVLKCFRITHSELKKLVPKVKELLSKPVKPGAVIVE